MRAIRREYRFANVFGLWDVSVLILQNSEPVYCRGHQGRSARVLESTRVIDRIGIEEGGVVLELGYHALEKSFRCEIMNRKRTMYE